MTRDEHSSSPSLRPHTTTVVTYSRRVQFECNILRPDYLVWSFIADRTYVLDTGPHAAMRPTGRHLPPAHAGRPSSCTLRRKLDNVSVGNISRTDGHRPPTAVSRCPVPRRSAPRVVEAAAVGAIKNPSRRRLAPLRCRSSVCMPSIAAAAARRMQRPTEAVAASNGYLLLLYRLGFVV